MFVKVKEKFEMARHVKNIFYVDKEMQDIMIEYYLIKRNLIISILLLTQHNCLISRRSSIQKSI